MIRLSGEQQKIFDAITSNLHGVQTLGGYAGTGKTTIIAALKEHLPRFAVCAYTGKAAHVLRQKGCEATTIHQLIYCPVDNSLVAGILLQKLSDVLSREHKQSEVDALLSQIKEAKQPSFILRSELSDERSPIEGVIVDEASMVPEHIYSDLLTFGLPLIFVGDHGQLPPVSEDNDGFNLMKEPMYRLETIHRNAGPIAYFAEHLRNGGLPRRFSTNCNTVQVLGRGSATTALLRSADQVICPFNKSRVEANRKIHESLYGKEDLLMEGERIICLRNDHPAGLYNGQQGTVTKIDEERLTLDFEDDAGVMHVDIDFDPEQFGAEKYQYQRGGAHPFDYGYTVTCHKSQGSEWQHVVVLDQGWKWEYPRWSYTAASRAKERLTWIC